MFLRTPGEPGDPDKDSVAFLGHIETPFCRLTITPPSVGDRSIIRHDDIDVADFSNQRLYVAHRLMNFLHIFEGIVGPRGLNKLVADLNASQAPVQGFPE